MARRCALEPAHLEPHNALRAGRAPTPCDRIAPTRRAARRSVRRARASHRADPRASPRRPGARRPHLPGVPRARTRARRPHGDGAFHPSPLQGLRASRRGAPVPARLVGAFPRTGRERADEYVGARRRALGLGGTRAARRAPASEHHGTEGREPRPRAHHTAGPGMGADERPARATRGLDARHRRGTHRARRGSPRRDLAAPTPRVPRQHRRHAQGVRPRRPAAARPRPGAHLRWLAPRGARRGLLRPRALGRRVPRPLGNDADRVRAPHAW